MDPADIVRSAMSQLRFANDAFVRTLKPRLSHQAALGAVGAFLIGFGVFASLVPQGLELGDAPLYAEYIAESSLGYATKHIGYYMLAIAFTQLVPLGFDFALNLMSAVLAALSVSLASTIAYTLAGRMSAALGTAAALFTPYVFVVNAVFAEVYIAQLFFFLLCVQFVLWNRPVTGGFAFASAFLVTPSSALAVPFLLLLRPRKTFVCRFALSAVLPCVVVLAPVYRDFLWGGHGVLNLAPGNVDRMQGLIKELTELLGFSALLAFVVAGLVALVRSRSHRLFVAGVASLWLLQFLAGERYSDVPVQLPLYGILAIVAGIGLAWLMHHWPEQRFVPGLAVAAFVTTVAFAGVTTYHRIAGESQAVDEYHDTILAIGAQADEGDVAVAPFAFRKLGEYYLHGDTSPSWIDGEALAGMSGERSLEDSRRRLLEAIESRRSVWLPGHFDPSAYTFFESQGYEIVPFELIHVARPLEAAGE